MSLKKSKYTSLGKTNKNLKIIWKIDIHDCLKMVQSDFFSLELGKMEYFWEKWSILDIYDCPKIEKPKTGKMG